MASEGKDFPTFTIQEMNVLGKIRARYPRLFFANVTKFFQREIYNYIRDARVFRCSIMGEVRTGKSESAQSIAKWYIQIFNKFLKMGLFEKIDIFEQGFLNKEPLTLSSKYIYGNQSEYIYSLREQQKEGKLPFGQIHIIDETREGVGGLGSFSEELELKNLNNIVAKFMQSEIWLSPNKLALKNCPYGVRLVKKDLKERVNWGMLYKLDTEANSITSYDFLGWVKIPLHNDEELRKEYNQKKNKWIEHEYQGNVDPRAIERNKLAEKLSKDNLFSTMKGKKGTTFILSKDQQVSMLERWIIEKKTQRWNEQEIYRIVESARLIILEKVLAENIEKDKQENLEQEGDKE